MVLRNEREELLKDPEIAELYYKEMWKSYRDLRRVDSWCGWFWKALWSITRR